MIAAVFPILAMTLVGVGQLPPLPPLRATPLSDQVLLDVSSDRETYYPGERIRLQLSFKNISAEPVRGRFVLHPSLGPNVIHTAPGGSPHVLQCFGAPSGTVATPVRILAPEEVISITADVSLNALEGVSQAFVLDRAGIHNFQLEYQDIRYDPSTVLRSNILSVEVVPIPAEEQPAQAAYTMSLAYVAQIERGANSFLTPAEVFEAASFVDLHRRSRYAGPVREGLVKYLQYRVGTQRASDDERTLYEKLTRKDDATAPELHLEVSSAMLWPPNHKLEQILVDIGVSDDLDPSPVVKLESVTCDDGCNPAEDVVGAEVGTDDREFELRAERSGSGSGRSYSITYSATDASGNRRLAGATVVVPHDQRKK
jgi:hypothetical protein